MLLLLAACQSPTVPDRGPQVQVTPEPDSPAAAGPPEALAPDQAAAREPDAVASYLAETAVTEIQLDRAIKIALLLPLSGRHGRIGQAMLNAAQLALFDVADERFSLIVRDTGGTPEGARAAVRSALGEGVRLILGPLFATSAEAVAPEARLAGVNVIAFSNDRSVAGDGVFVMGLAPRPQIWRLVGYASRQGLTRFAVLAPKTRYGDAVVQALQEAVLRNGAELSRVVSYKPGAIDLTAEVRALADYETRRKALLEQRQILADREDEAAKLALKRLDDLETLGAPDFEAVVLPEGGNRLQAIAPLLAYFDVDPAEIRYLGTALWDDPRLGTEPALNGGWFTAPPPDLWTAFRERYQKTFGAEPPRIAALAFDATALAAVLTRRAAGREPDFTVPVLTQISGFSGVDGLFRFLPSGEVERSLAILEMRRGGFEVLEAAPTSFQRLGY
ncbi:MAG: penicillin-binding protein activator [Kiloniellaceae bacterium]